MGKSTLVRFAVQKAQEFGIPIVLVAGSRIERYTAYYVWRSVLASLLLPRGAAPDGLTETVSASLAKAPGLQPFAPLLCDILPLPIAQTQVTRQMDAAARATMTAQLLLHLVKDAQRSALLIFEDAHWIDSTSWSVIAKAERQLPGHRLFLTMRPEAMLPREATEFADRHRSQGIHLDGLSEVEIAELVALRLGAHEVAPEVGRFIHERSAGNPFFAEELALALRERGQVAIEGASCVTAAALGKHSLLGLPDTVRAAVLGRIDRLSARQQLLLKVAAVIGAVAPMKAVKEIFSTVGDSDDIADELAVFQGRLLAEVEDRDGDAVLAFRHGITQESAYSLLTPSQRRLLHGAVGLWYEKEYADQTEQWLPLLAHHFGAANESSKALSYLQRAGEHALQAHANREAVQFLDAAIGLEGELPGPAEERARRRRLLAEAHLKLSHLASCGECLRQALALAGKPLPRSAAAVVLDTGTALLGLRARTVGGRPAGVLAAQLHQLRAEVAYFEHDTLALLHSTFVGLREALTGGPTRELASAHGTAAIVLGLLRLHRLSRRHCRAALEAASRAGHAPTAAYVQHLACVVASAVGDWLEAEQAIELAADGYRNVGDQYRWVTTRMILAYQALHRGDFDRIDAYLGEIDAHTIFPAGPVQLRTWYRTVQLAACNARAASGRELPSPRLLAQVQALADMVDPSQGLLCRGFLADALLLRGDLDAARHQTELGLALLRGHRPTTYFSLLGIASIANACLELRTRSGGNAQALLDDGRFAGRCLRRFALMVPIAKPCWLLHDGRLRMAHGQIRRGCWRLRAAAKLAGELGMLGVEAAAHRSLASARRAAPERAGGLAWA
jgi:adenylate cyclase